MNKIKEAANVLFVCSVEPKFGMWFVTLHHKGKLLQWLEQDRQTAIDNVFRILKED